jgi:hypothetical protein
MAVVSIFGRGEDGIYALDIKGRLIVPTSEYRLGPFF